jgi:F0F1-type ATP synthase membrane subunit c/vacuolar-type H+-ATPase subunit K
MTSDEARVVWQSMAAVEQARVWHAIDPDMARRLIDMTQQHERHEQRLDWAYFALRISALVAGLTSVVVLGVVAWHYANVHATGQGLAVFCSGAAAVASVFLGTTGVRAAARTRKAK